jgi:hypothetical protein
MLHDVGVFVAVSVCVYAVPIFPSGRLAVVTAGVAVTVTEYDCALLVPTEFLAVTEKVNVPAAVGVPLMIPVPAFKVRPVGKVPDATAHVVGEFVAESVCEYAVLVFPPARLVVVMTGTVLILIDNCCELLPAWLVAVTVKVYFPAVVGVPLMTPLLVFIERPVGKLPEVMLHDVGVFNACRVCE